MKVKGITIYADEGEFIGRKGAKFAEDFCKATTMRKGESKNDFVEVDKLPESGYEYGWNYDEEVNRRIRRKYSESNELAILRQRDVKPEEYAVYNNYCEECKVEARDYKAEYIREAKEREEEAEKARIEWEKEEAKRKEEERKAEEERLAKEEAERKAWEDAERKMMEDVKK